MTSFAKGLLPLGLFAALAIFLAIGLTRDPSQLPSELIDKPFPSLEMTTLSEEPVTEEALRGQVSIVNVFGSWCVACLVEHPLLMDLSEDPSLNVVGVNWRDTREKARVWLDRHGDPYDLIIFDGDSRLAINLGVSGAPETFIVDPNGQIRYKHTGPITAEVWEDTLSPLIRSLNAQKR